MSEGAAVTHTVLRVLVHDHDHSRTAFSFHHTAHAALVGACDSLGGARARV